ncbi:MAG: DUF2336 domain-containing protein [Alphaproteobacteria bacterium]|jgi:uncharacterized protein (DUF2336 family)|nr:DUF2336 domain-containing protein [Alphaproteobacteria bacterium]
MSQQLTRADVARLLSDPSAESRAGLAGKMTGQIDRPDLSSKERVLVEDILRTLVHDTSVMVREALAANLKYAVNVPHDVALDLAEDIDRVAIPMLEFSRVLSDEDLIRLVGEGSEARQVAIARRPEVSEAVSDALIDTDSQRVVETLVANDGAQITESGMHRVVDRFGDVPSVQEPLVKRATLPLTVAERMVTLVSEHLQNHLMNHHELTPDTATELVMRAREKATVDLAGGGPGDAEVEALVRQLARGGRLTPSLILRALCVGDLPFFETALAVLADVPVVNARVLIHDAGPLGLKSLYDKAGLPGSLLPAIRTGLEVLHETDFRSADYDRESFSRIVLERILTQADDLSAEDADYLLRRLTDLAPPEIAA